MCTYTGCLKSKYTLSNLIFFSGTDYKALIFSENIAFITTNFKYSLHLPPTHIITGRITQEMRCKIAVWQEAYGSVKQTQCLFDREFKINSDLTRRTIFAIHRKFMATGSEADTKRSGKPRSRRSEKTFRS